MISGICPYCEKVLLMPCPDEMPVYQKYTCEHCGEWFWEYYSRIFPTAYKQDEVDVDEETHTIKIIGEDK